MRTAVAFCLFGEDENDIYVQGFLQNERMYREFYGSESHHIYLYLPPRLFSALETTVDPQMTSLIEVPGLPEDQTATFWRFRALKEVQADFYLFRDADSRPIARERACVSEWIESGKDYHVIRDHQYHNMPMLAGLWGCTAYAAKRIQILPRLIRKSFYGVDQVYLQNFVWPMARKSLYASVDCEWDFNTETHPIQGDFSEGFVGAGLYGDDRLRNPEHARGRYDGVVYSSESPSVF